MARLGRAARPMLLGLVAALLAGALAAVVGPLAAAPVAAPARADTTYGAPSWWKGDCDTDNWTPKARAAGWTGAPAGRLGGQVLGIPVCGPRNLAGGPNVWWSRPGWGELEWQCVEFAQRFMIQVYGTQPYQGNGVDIVRNYTTAQGGGLVRVDNGTVGKAPAPGDVVSFSSPSNVYGHVAVVASSAVDTNGNGSVRLATQNDTADGWRTLAVTNWKMAAFGSLYPYAWLHDPQNRGGGGAGPVGGDSSVTEGTFVSFGGTTYRIAGGAPLVVTGFAAVGGAPTQVVALDADRFAGLRAVPRDGTFLRDPVSGARWRVAGGMPLPVTSCTATGLNGCAGSVDIDAAAVRAAGGTGVYAHLRSTVADGAFVRVGDDGRGGLGTITRAAGGALFSIDDCDDIGGCGTWTTVEGATVAAYRSAHPTPVDGTVTRLQPSGRTATWAGGQCALPVTAPAGGTDVPDRTVVCSSALAGVAPTTALVRGRTAATAFTATGGTAPYRWTLVAGSVPLGTTMAADGRVSGVPTVAGDSAVTVRVTDAVGATTTLATTWSVAPEVAMSVPTTARLTAGTPVYLPLSATGGSGRYLWTVLDPLPAGLVVAADGLLAGKTTVVGTSAVRIRVVDTNAPTYGVTGTITLVVGA